MQGISVTTIVVFVILGIMYIVSVKYENKNNAPVPTNQVPKMVSQPSSNVAPSVVSVGTIYYTEDGGGRTYSMEITNSMDNFEDGTVLSFNLRKKV